MRRSLLVALLLLSWALLVVQLDERSLWVDEFLTLQMTRGAPADVVAASMADLHPPLYFLALHGWTGLAGASDFALRWPSAAFGLVGVALLPGVARRAIGPRAALPAALLLALAPAFVEFSRMARYYSLVLALGLLSTRLLLDAVNANTWRRWLMYGASGLALVYTFYPAGILPLGHGLFFVAPRSRMVSGRWLAAAIAIAIGFAPWLLASGAGQASRVSAGAGADLARSGLGFGLGIAASAYTFAIGETIFPWRPEAWLGIVVVAVSLVAALRRGARRAFWQWAGLTVLCIAFMSGVTTFVSVGTPFLNVPVRGLFVLPFLIILLAGGLASLRSVRAGYLLAGALLVVWSIGIANIFAGRQFLNPIYLTPSKEAAALVRRDAADTDLVISDYDSVFGHYFLPAGATPKHVYTDQIAGVQAALATSQPTRIWLVTIGRDQTQRISTAESVREMLSRDYRLERTEPMLPIDPTYLRVKDSLLRRETYAHRLTIEVYRRATP